MAVPLQICPVIETPSVLPAAPGPPAGFGITVSESGGRTQVFVQGELDVLTVPELRSVLRGCAEHGRSDVVVDLRALEFLDARGLSALVEGWRLLDERHRRLTISSPSPGTRRLLDLTGLSEIFGVQPPAVAANG